ncbi:MAG: tRNA (uridine(34)/cytosine(34)/5-carboxymethylaminomethyluridine(34)-2'-O)-methyltransferase TrmL [Spirochaetaceae bacterium]|nr:tRNA (uridine(34)/cytosine(34)/5-carboxymethylaminomethyluridine(34)-2'-O)-methyltransferase TrmL [Spirochaetaceae bacterium]|tara:strand:+ start:69741 stop:70259 length:519 start_codon:yes stop_codon:yes gene_type:complete
MEIALFEPEIPPNTGNIIRLSVCTGTALHIVGKPAFSLEDAMLRRAGLDYWQLSRLRVHDSLEDFLLFLSQRDDQSIDEVRSRFVLTTRFARNNFVDHRYTEDQILLFGKETAGLPDSVRGVFADLQENWLRIPVSSHCRSLNLANSVSIVLYEGLRQLGFPGLQLEPPSDT